MTSLSVVRSQVASLASQWIFLEQSCEFTRPVLVSHGFNKAQNIRPRGHSATSACQSMWLWG
jgi:hypothetical protein